MTRISTRPITVYDLQQAYLDATRNQGLIAFITECARGIPQKIDSVNSMFKSQPLWEPIKQSSGHISYKHRITHIVVGFQGHNGAKKDNNIHSAILKVLHECVQKHVNLLGNEIFQYKQRSWKSEPDYDESLKRYIQWEFDRTHQNVKPSDENLM